MTVFHIINFILVGAVAVTAGIIMNYWHRATAGGWKEHPSGKSLMGLLGIITLITGNAAVQWVIAPHVPLAVRAGFYYVLYLVMIYALVRIGLVIRDEVRRGRRRQQNLPESGRIGIAHMTKETP